MDKIEIVREFYNSSVEHEWTRIENRPEFLLTYRFIERYAKRGSTVLDIGGGPGRYSIHLAQLGCDVTLLDLSPKNAEFAATKATELGLSIKTHSGDAREADKIVDGKYDCILLMGPMYHLTEEIDRVAAMDAALRLLKPGGVICVSYISATAGMVYAMKDDPACVTHEEESSYIESILENRSYSGQAFTHAYFASQHEILPFMQRFPFEKLHFFAQEGMMSPCEGNIMSSSPETVAKWLDICEVLCEREELLSWGEHLMYIGRKNSAIKGSGI